MTHLADTAHKEDKSAIILGAGKKYVQKVKTLCGFAKSKRVRASFTIEAAVVVPICMIVLTAVILTAFNLHDNVVLKAAGPSLVLESAAELNSDEKKGYDYEAYFKRRLIVLKNAVIKSSEKDDGVVFGSSADLNAHLEIVGLLLKNSLGSQNAQMEIMGLKARKKLTEYKILCDAAEKAGLAGGQEKD